MTTPSVAAADPRLIPINWPVTQTLLGVKADNDPGPITYAALFTKAAQRQPDDTIRAIGKAAAEHFPAYGMTTRNRVAEFVAQCCNETGGFRVFEENLSYSATALRRTWPSRFPTDASARAVAYKPEAIANKVYARPAEGNTAPGDGWRYRGRGMLQLTFKNNYAAASKRIGIDLVAMPELAADPAVSTLIALDFWKRGRVNDACDASDWRLARSITNGGAIGLRHVAAIRGRILSIIV